MKNYIQNGANLTITASADITSGECVVIGDIVGVAVTDIANTKQGADRKSTRLTPVTQ